MTAYEPGTVAVATVRGVPNVRIFGYHEGGGVFRWDSGERIADSIVHHDRHVTDVRPLVVLDPEGEGFHVAEMAADLRKRGHVWLADQIEAQTKPPKPAEPGKYGAVIAGDGREWIRYTDREISGRDWIRVSHPDEAAAYAKWSDLDVLRVTNEGVPA